MQIYTKYWNQTQYIFLENEKELQNLIDCNLNN